MINKKYEKQCNVEVLDMELKMAGFDIYGVSGDSIQTIVHLKDTETKDPNPIVDAHKYLEPKLRDWKTEFGRCKTDTERIQKIAELLGLK
jgi:hypothetical protein